MSEAYCLLPGDLREPERVAAALTRAGFDPRLPTYVLAECVLVYMEPAESAAVVRWLSGFLTSAACMVYEQVPCVSLLHVMCAHVLRTCHGQGFTLA